MGANPSFVAEDEDEEDTETVRWDCATTAEAIEEP